jgi:hypothetical protein
MRLFMILAGGIFLVLVVTLGLPGGAGPGPASLIGLLLIVVGLAGGRKGKRP